MTDRQQERAKEMLRQMEEEERELARYGYRFPALFTAVGFLLTLEAERAVGEQLPKQEG